MYSCNTSCDTNHLTSLDKNASHKQVSHKQVVYPTSHRINKGNRHRGSSSPVRTRITIKNCNQPNMAGKASFR